MGLRHEKGIEFGVIISGNAEHTELSAGLLACQLATYCLFIANEPSLFWH